MKPQTQQSARHQYTPLYDSAGGSIWRGDEVLRYPVRVLIASQKVKFRTL